MFNWNIPSSNIAIFLLILWEVLWKGIGLWKSAKRGDIWWFIAMFVINFFGIIPIIYLWYTKQLDGVLEDIFKLRFKKK